MFQITKRREENRLSTWQPPWYGWYGCCIKWLAGWTAYLIIELHNRLGFRRCEMQTHHLKAVRQRFDPNAVSVSVTVIC